MKRIGIKSSILNRTVMLVFGISLFWVIDAPFSQASSPSSSHPENAGQAFNAADVVFIGEVTDIKKDPLGFDSIAEVHVQKIYKGEDIPVKVWIDGMGGPTYPARIFQKGQRSLFYVIEEFVAIFDSLRGSMRPVNSFLIYPPHSLFRADSYENRVLPIADAGDDLRFLEWVMKKPD